MSNHVDHYNPCNMLRRDVFSIALDYIESGQLTERDVTECLKECLEFFWSSASQDVVRDFCIIKVRRGMKRSKDAQA